MMILNFTLVHYVWNHVPVSYYQGSSYLIVEIDFKGIASRIMHLKSQSKAIQASLAYVCNLVLTLAGVCTVQASQ